MSRVLMEGSFYPYRCVPQFGRSARWSQSGTNAAPDRIANRHLLRPRLPCIAQVTPRHMTAIRAEPVRGVRPRPPWTTIVAVDPRGTTRRPRSGASAVAVAPGRPRCGRIGGPGPTTGTGTATERDRASTRGETGRDRGRAEGPARGTRDGAAVVIAAETGTGTGRAAGTTPGRPPTNPMSWRSTERGRGR